MTKTDFQRMAKTRYVVWLALGLAALTGAGCQSMRSGGPMAIAEQLDIPNGVPWKADKEPKPGVPARIAATWTNAVRQQPGQGSERGFGGRLYFYGAKEAEPITVEGQLVVYAFDETGRKPTDNRPTRRYVFPADQFAKHRSESEFGVSYSVWLPWGDVQGPSTNVSLIARFEPLQGGTLLVSEQASSRLPGLMGEPVGVGTTSVASSELKPVVEQAVMQASHATPTNKAANNMAPKRRMETTSIKLPRAGVAGPVGGASGWKTEVSFPAPTVAPRSLGAR